MESYKTRNRYIQRLDAHQAGCMFPCSSRPSDQIVSDIGDDESFANFLPLTKVSVKTEIKHGLAETTMTQVYLNPVNQNNNKKNTAKRFNLVYKFPQEKDTILKKIEITVDNRKIESAIEILGQMNGVVNKEVPFGKNANIVSDAREKVDLVGLFIGDVQHGSTITVKVSLVRAIIVE